mmetsp:Transcript_18312/g.57602  ORF Transcript_18312/g.57602 Transcript_18312/m.57602 type:complete len:265 (-) Transcript_18312:46-840(-)
MEDPQQESEMAADMESGAAPKDGGAPAPDEAKPKGGPLPSPPLPPLTLGPNASFVLPKGKAGRGALRPRLDARPRRHGGGLGRHVGGGLWGVVEGRPLPLPPAPCARAERDLQRGQNHQLVRHGGAPPQRRGRPAPPRLLLGASLGRVRSRPRGSRQSRGRGRAAGAHRGGRLLAGRGHGAPCRADLPPALGGHHRAQRHRLLHGPYRRADVGALQGLRGLLGPWLEGRRLGRVAAGCGRPGSDGCRSTRHGQAVRYSPLFDTR